MTTTTTPKKIVRLIDETALDKIKRQIEDTLYDADLPVYAAVGLLDAIKFDYLHASSHMTEDTDDE
jgi:hypothetical protein